MKNIVNAVMHDGNGKRTDNAWLRAEGGKITATGTGQPDASASANAQRIDASGFHLYPGFILLNNPLGLAEIEAVRATIDCSNKQWDVSLKTLTKNQLLKVFKEEDVLYIKKC